MPLSKPRCWLGRSESTGKKSGARLISGVRASYKDPRSAFWYHHRNLLHQPAKPRSWIYYDSYGLVRTKATICHTLKLDDDLGHTTLPLLHRIIPGTPISFFRILNASIQTSTTASITQPVSAMQQLLLAALYLSRKSYTPPSIPSFPCEAS